MCFFMVYHKMRRMPHNTGLSMPHEMEVATKRAMGFPPNLDKRIVVL